MGEYSIVDLFCGVGGLTHGFVQEDFNVLAGVDADPACRYPFEKNNGTKFIHKQIQDVSPKEVSALYPKDHIKILVGCAPCQPFSSYSVKTSKGRRWKLLYSFSELITAVCPDVVSMENVVGLKRFAGGKIFRDFVQTLENNGYYVTSYDVYCPDYGIPQNRTRLVLFASRFDRVEIVPKTHKPERYRTVRDVIYNLEPLRHGESAKYDPLHCASRLSRINQLRIAQSMPGGTWRDWDEELVAKCHKKKTGRTYPSVYGRMTWDDPAPTMTTQCYGFGNGRFGHPEQDRAISLREAAMLQTFPKKYAFVEPGEPIAFKRIGRLIGNAVPVRLGRVIARSIKKHLERHDV